LQSGDESGIKNKEVNMAEAKLYHKLDGKIHAVGRRKESVARVYLKKGQGNINVNGRPAEEYFSADPFIKERLEQVVKKPFYVTNTVNKFDVEANSTGGGITGQLEAIRLGIARALLGVDEGFKKPLKDEGLLTRDPRMVERKKYGFHKARRGQQFSKR